MISFRQLEDILDHVENNPVLLDYVSLGPCPCGEEAVQVGEPDYLPRAVEQSRRYIKLLKEKLGSEPGTAMFNIKYNSHDFGTYVDVVCYFDNNDQEGREFAVRAERCAPTKWGNEASHAS